MTVKQQPKQRNLMRLRTAVILFTGLCLLTMGGCGGKKDKVPAKDGWKIVLRDGKQQLEYRLSVMNIYVTDPVAAAEYPEAFEIFGENVHLLGSFPLEKRVGYDSNIDVLLNTPITVKMQMMNARDYKIENAFSTIVLGGDDRKYVKGQIIFRERSGKTTGRDGDITLSGEITLEIGTGADRKTLTGTISVHPVAWG